MFFFGPSLELELLAQYSTSALQVFIVPHATTDFDQK